MDIFFHVLTLALRNFPDLLFLFRDSIKLKRGIEKYTKGPTVQRYFSLLLYTPISETAYRGQTRL